MFSCQLNLPLLVLLYIYIYLSSLRYMSADRRRAGDLMRLGHRGIIYLCLRGSRLSLGCARRLM
jgi:hypothetical protein